MTGPQPTTGTAARKSEQSETTVFSGLVALKALYIQLERAAAELRAMQAACELQIMMAGLIQTIVLTWR